MFKCATALGLFEFETRKSMADTLTRFVFKRIQIIIVSGLCELMVPQHLTKTKWTPQRLWQQQPHSFGVQSGLDIVNGTVDQTA